MASGSLGRMEWVYAALMGYFFGSLPFGYWFGLVQNKNLMAEGTGNVGARNAWRVLGAVPGVMVGILDVTKGLMAVALGEFLARDPAGGLLAGAVAVWGHCFSVWLLGRGGKGLATAAGTFVAVNPLLLLVWAGMAGVAYLLSRSLYRAVLLAALVFPVAAAVVGQSLVYLWFGFGVAVPVILRHLADWNRTPQTPPAEPEAKVGKKRKRRRS